MRWAIVCGDGLPVSGLLTVFRNVVHGVTDGLVELPIAADLGYSWRPDKKGYFPAGPPDSEHPSWMDVSREMPAPLDAEALGAEMADIRERVADPGALERAGREDLARRVDALAAPYAEYFLRWWDRAEVDWVIAVNMTLSDSVPVTVGLHRAAARRWGGSERPGGVLFWDHDLFGSCSIYENGARVYPAAPNAFTPVPPAAEGDRWAVVSTDLAGEAGTYPTELRADVVPNVLPEVPGGALEARHREFLAERGVALDRPVVLVPVRVFRVKGVEIAVEVFAGMRAAAGRAGLVDPVLLVFGSLSEEPDYGEELSRSLTGLGVADAVRFLDGVPLTSHRDAGRWRLDEVDLLRIARASGGAVLFTPSRPDVETVGLGPALAAVAGLPCAVTPYTAFEPTFGSEMDVVTVDPADPAAGGAELVTWMTASRTADGRAARALRANDEAVRARFDAEPWRRLMREMNAACDRLPVGEAVS